MLLKIKHNVVCLLLLLISMTNGQIVEEKGILMERTELNNLEFCPNGRPECDYNGVIRRIRFDQALTSESNRIGSFKLLDGSITKHKFCSHYLVSAIKIKGNIKEFMAEVKLTRDEAIMKSYIGVIVLLAIVFGLQGSKAAVILLVGLVLLPESQCVATEFYYLSPDIAAYYFNAVQVDKNGDYVAVGNRLAWNFFQKFYQNGTVAWSFTPTVDPFWNPWTTIDITEDNQYLVAGNGRGPPVVYRFNSNGIFQGARNIGELGTGYAFGLKVLDSTYYAVAAELGCGIGVYPINEVSTKLWSRTDTSTYCYIKDIIVASTGEIVIEGYRYNITLANYDCYFARFNPTSGYLNHGSHVRYLSSSQEEYCYGIAEAPDGGFIHGGKILGVTYGGWNFWVVKTDSSGINLWHSIWGTNNEDYITGLKKMPNGDIALCGNSFNGTFYYPYLFIMSSKDGAFSFNKQFANYPSSSIANHYFHGMTLTPENAVVLVGQGYNYAYVLLIQVYFPISCVAGTFANFSSSPISCVDCPKGKYQPTERSISCLNTSAGYYVDFEKAISQTPCPAGTYSFVGGASLSQCLPCDIGYYQPNTGSTSCTLCSAGNYCDTTGMAAQKPCLSGTYQSTTGKNSCDPCPAGYYQPNSGMTSCIQCLIGKYQNLTGQTSCVDCSPGSFTSVNGTINCSLCSAGNYQSSSGSTGCLPCPVGRAQDLNGQPICNKCAQGYYQPTTGNQYCIECPVGQYQDLEEQISCKNCSVAYYNDKTKQMACAPCGIGTYQNLTGKVSCTLCPAGQYQGQEAQTSCTNCSVGYYASTQGNSQCSACGGGTYQDLQGQLFCKNCTVGTYQNLTAQTSCVSCPTGTYANEIALPSCKPCAVGEFQDLSNQTSCKKCPLGSYQNKTGQIDCNICRRDLAAISVGTENCQTCDPGWYPSESREKCLYKGIFNSASEFSASDFSTYCFNNSGIIKPTTPNCRSSYRPLCCAGRNIITNVSCNYGLGLIASNLLDPLDDNFNQYCEACTFYNLLSCPLNGLCWDVSSWTSNSQTPYPANFTLNCLEAIKDYCGNRFMANINDSECFLFRNQCNAVVTNCTYGQKWDTFQIAFNTMLPSVLPPCNTLFDLARNPVMKTGNITCNRSSDYTIDVNVSGLANPVLNFSFADKVLKDACGAYINSSRTYFVVIPEVEREVITVNGSTNDKCMDLTIYSNLSRIYSWSIIEQYWNVTYLNNSIPSGIYNRTLILGNFNKTSITITDIDLISGYTLEIYSYVKTPYGTTHKSNLIHFTVPQIKSGKTYCGPCQFDNRTKCLAYDGSCWINHKNNLVNDPFNTPACLQAVKKDCYAIWIEQNRTNYQCLDFVPYFNFAKMQLIPKIVGAAYGNDGKSLKIVFDNSMNTEPLDISKIFPSNICNSIPSKKMGKWLDSYQYQVEYDPSTNFFTEITILDNAFHNDYEYYILYLPTQKIKAKFPPLNAVIQIKGSTLVSECSTVDLRAVTISSPLYKLTFKWTLTYTTTGMDASTEQAYNNLVQESSKYNTAGVLTIPATFLIRDRTIEVVLTAKASSYETNEISIKSSVSIVESVPDIKFNSKSASFVVQMDGNKNSTIPLTANDKKCAKGSGSAGDKIPVEVSFALLYGNSDDNITNTGDEESSLAANITKMYSTFKTLVVGSSYGFKYLRYYNLTVTIRDKICGRSNSDNIGMRFVKPLIKSVIDVAGSLITTGKDIVINGSNSEFLAGADDEKSYKWECTGAMTIQVGGKCSCPDMPKDKWLEPVIILSSSAVAPLCKYGFTLTVTAKNGDYVRTASSDTEFITYDGNIAPLKGVIVKGTHPTIKDLYFTFQMPESADAPKDSDITFVWNLVGIKHIDSTSTANYNIKNTYIYNFFVNDLKATVDESIKKEDLEIPEKVLPIYLTSTKTRVLGVDKASLLPMHKYTFGVTVYYPESPSFLFISFVTPQVPRNRTLTVTPRTGIGLDTNFLISFALDASATDPDEAQYQIYRRDCPSNSSDKTPITQMFSMSNSYSTVLAPGSKDCDYQVEIIVRAYEYDDNIDMKFIITVNESSKTAAEIIGDCLSSLNGSDSMPVGTVVTLLSEVSGVKVTEKTNASVDATKFIVDQLSTFDQPDGVLQTMAGKEQVMLLMTSASTLSKLCQNQQTNMDSELATKIKEKASNYIDYVDGKEGSTNIIGSILGTLKGVADVGSNEGANASFFSDLKAPMQKMSDMKLAEMPPGSPPCNLGPSNADMLVAKSYASDFDKNQTYNITGGAQMNLPEGLKDQMMDSLGSANLTRLLQQNGNESQSNISTSTSTSTTITMGTSIHSTMFNPNTAVKENGTISKKSLNVSQFGLDSGTVDNLYSDMRKGGLNNAINKRDQDTPIMSLEFKPYQLMKNASEKPINTSINVGSLKPGKIAIFKFPLKNGTYADYMNGSLMVPMYYLADTQTWSNENCSILDGLPTDILIQVGCTHLKAVSNRAIKDINEAFRVTVDVVKDVLKVISAGNYQQLINVANFFGLGTRNAAVYTFILGMIALVVSVELFLVKMDKRYLYEAKRKVLFERFNPPQLILQRGVLYDIFSFLGSLRKNRLASVTKKSQRNVLPVVTATESKLTTKPKLNYNGLSVLTHDEKVLLKDLYELYKQCSMIFDDSEVDDVMAEEFNESVILTRITTVEIDQELTRKPVTFCAVMKYEHPVIGCFAKPELTTPRPIKFLILICAIVGEVFVSGFFYNTDSSSGSSQVEVSSGFLVDAVIYSIASAVLMIPLKIIMSMFLMGTVLYEEMSRAEIENIEKKSETLRIVGCILGGSWLVACTYCIAMYLLNFSDNALNGWLATYSLAFFNETILISQLKIITKVVVGYFIMRISRTKLLMSSAGIVAAAFVDKVIRLL